MQRSNPLAFPTVDVRYLIAVLIAFFACIPAVDGQTFTVDFSQSSSSPLVKDKFGVYQTPLKTQQTIERASQLLTEAQVRDIRFEIGIGKAGALAYDQVSGSAGNLRYDFSSIDGLVRTWTRAGARPLLAMTYDPLPLQTNTVLNAWKNVPSDLPSWSEVNGAYSSHLLKRQNIPGIFFEQWNEPDLPDGSGGKVFFNGDQSDYGNVFRYGLAGIREGDPDALVGGPAAAYDLSYLDTIWAQHPDFGSIHAYGNYLGQLDNLRGHNGDLVFTPSVPMLLTEYNSYTSFGLHQPNSLHPAAAAFFNDVNGMLNISDAVKVYWAQWVDDSVGMITDDLHKKALYNAYKMYQTMLPVDRSPVTPSFANNVGAMASSDAHNAAIVLYNNGTADATTTVALNHLPFSNGVGEVYFIDSTHASYLDGAPEDLAPSSSWVLNGSETSRIVTVKAQSVALVKLHDGSGLSLLGENRIGQYVRSEYYFFNRIFTFEDDSFDDLDPRTSIARLGMATTTSNSQFGVVFAGNVYDDPVHKFTVTTSRQGPFSKNDNNSIFGLRIDYQSTNGSYTRSVLFHNGLYDPTRTSQLPWGEGTAVPDQAILENDMNTGRPFPVDLAQYAPADWNHKRIIVSPIMQNAGYGSYARLILRPVPLRCFGFAHGDLIDIPVSDCNTNSQAPEENEFDLTRVGDPMPRSIYLHRHSGTLNSRISDLKPGETYNLRLHFAENEFSEPGHRRFNVVLNGKQVLEDLDIAAESGGKNRALVKQVAAMADAEGTIRLKLEDGKAGIPLIDGMEIY